MERTITAFLDTITIVDIDIGTVSTSYLYSSAHVTLLSSIIVILKMVLSKHNEFHNSGKMKCRRNEGRKNNSDEDTMKSSSPLFAKPLFR